MIQIKRTTVNTILERLGWGESATAMRWNCTYSLALWELNFIHREIILLTKGCKKTNFLIQAEYFSPLLIPLKSFHLYVQTTTPRKFRFIAGPVIDT